MHRVARAAHLPVYYTFDQWRDQPDLRHGVFTRLGGVSRAPFDSLNVGGTVGDQIEAVRENLSRIYAVLDVDGTRACTVWQVHSADVVLVTARTEGRHWQARADGMVTNVPGLPLTMRFADCTPILLHDPVQGVIGIAHAGWRGTVTHVAGNTVRAMQSAYGTDPAHVRACIGPSIGPSRYEVGPEVVAAAESAFGDVSDLVCRQNDSTYLDLWAANRRSLRGAGVPDDQIEVAGICTATHTDEFFSHRAEKGKTGRFCAVIALRES